MSLLNLIVHPERAYIITDSGHYGTDGIVTRLGPKSMVMEQMGIVIATAGRLQCMHLANRALANSHLSQAQFVSELPEIARSAYAAYGIDHPSVVAFAGYSHETNSAFGGVFACGDDPRSYRPIAKSVWLSPSATSVDESKLARPSTFNPYFEAVPLIDEQQRYNFGSGEKPICGIAGDIDIAAVSEAGVRVDTVWAYPARVGERVEVRQPSKEAAELVQALRELREVQPTQGHHVRGQGESVSIIH